jgi:predicted alpha/beta superfamily hydrolase
MASTAAVLFSLALTSWAGHEVNAAHFQAGPRATDDARSGGPAGAVVLPIASKALGESRPVWLHTPPECTRDKPCDVLVVLDGHALFPLAVSYAQVMRMMGRMDPLIVAGIPSWSREGRARDFIPTPGRTTAEQQRETDGSGAQRFIEFLEKEVLPAVEQAAPVTSKRVIAGHSLAGLFVVHVLTSSTLFEGHIALSPSLGWGGQKTLTGLIARLDTSIGTTRRLYASVANEPPAYRDTFTRLERALERSKSEWLVHRLRRFDAEDHTTTVAPALHDAMKWIYQSK